MGVESIKSPLQGKSPEDHLDAMLEEFPQESLARIEARLEGKPLQEQITIVEEALKKRREVLAGPRYISPRLRMIEKVSDKVFDRFLHRQEHQVEVGHGENGRVFEYVAAEGVENTVVFKMLIRAPASHQNDLMEEGAYQADVAAFAADNAELRVGVPMPYYVAASSKGYVLAMEKLPGMSIEQICEKNLDVPAEFDLDVLEANLTEFVRRMNREGFYHRDLREGNIMIDFDAGTKSAPAYVIDFGFCTKAGSQAEAYEGPDGVDGARDNVMISKVVEKLRARQGRVVQGV